MINIERQYQQLLGVEVVHKNIKKNIKTGII